VLGTLYVVVGIYGFLYCARSTSLRLQLAYFALQVPLGAWIVYLGKGAGLNALLLLPLAGHSAVLLPTLWMVLANVAILAAYVIPIEAILPGGWAPLWGGLQTFLAGQIFIIFFTQMAVSEERSRGEVHRLVADLEAANQRLREYASQVEELAITKERNRLAREIHDGLGHYLTSIHMQIQAARAVLQKNPARAAETLESAQKQAREALDDVRRSVAALRSPPVEERPLSETIATLLNSADAAGLSHDLKVAGAPRPLSPQASLTLFRAVQECLNNTTKHASAANFWVTLDYSPDRQVRLTVQDDGVGSGSLDGGFGLLGIRERVQMLNGAFSAVSKPGEGVKIEVLLPEAEIND
jgi:signal transduction histidine kinase